MNVRPFALSDLKAAARFCEAARARDRFVEPFADQLAALAESERARISLWRVLDAGELLGIAFAAARDAVALDVHVAVHPRARRRGFGRALLEPALAAQLTLRARVFEEAVPGRAFLAALGFVQRTAQLSLQLQQRDLTKAAPKRSASFALVRATRRSEPALLRLSSEAFCGAPQTFAAERSDVAQLFTQGRSVWLAELEGEPVGYVAARRLGSAIAIEELAVVPAARRLGIGRALFLRALQGAQAAVLTVSEDNLAARAFYGAVGFTVTSRRLVYQRKPLSAVYEKKPL